MKNYIRFFIALGSTFSFSCLAQQSSQDFISNNDLAVVSYHVEERVNMSFGSNITTYDVPSLNLVSTNDLGPNNTRIVTPKYGKVKAVAVAMNSESLKVLDNRITAIVNPIRVDVVAPKVKKDYVNIDVVGTYERVMDKGYKSTDMLIKVGDRHYFDGELDIAAKWYAELFTVKTDLDAVYYYRYAQSLKAINQMEKADEMMKIFESKSL